MRVGRAPPPAGAGHSERRRWPGGAGARVCGPAAFEKPGRAGALGPRESDVAGRTQWACARPGKGLRTPHHLLQNGHQRPAHVLHPAPSRPLSAAWPAFPGSGALLGLAFLLMDFRGPPSAHLRGPKGTPGTGLHSPGQGGGIVVTAGSQKDLTAGLESRGHVTAPFPSEDSSAGQRKPSLTTARETEIRGPCAITDGA